MKGLSHIFIRTCLALTAVVWMISCTEKRPEGILSRQEMVDVLEDLYIAEEKINRLGISQDSSKKVFQIIKDRVFESAAASDSTFKRSFDYYMERPREMELIYTALVDTLQLREQRAPFRIEHQ